MIRTKKTLFDQEILLDLQKKYFIFMLEVKDGVVSLLVDHWKYIDWKKKSPRQALYEDPELDDGYYYHYYKNAFSRL